MKQQRIDDDDDQWQRLPQHVTQHILSYMPTNCAAKMSLLSKSWYTMWSTNPILNIDLDDVAFNKVRCPKSIYWPIVVDDVRDEFMNYLNKSLKRYQNQNDCVHRLNLSMRCLSCPDSSFFIRKVFDNIEKEAGLVHGVCFSFTLCGTEHGLPDFFRILQAKQLRELNVKGCSLRQQFGYKEIKCCLLNRLFLENVFIDEATVQGLFSRCPLIESLKLVNFYGLQRIKVTNDLRYLKECVISAMMCINSEIEVESQSLESFCCYCPWRRTNLKLHPCQNLKKLSMHNLRIKDIFFRNLADEFPKLEDLIVTDCYGYERIDISGNWLKSITISIGSGDCGF
ncbi:hypothetical protein ACH5RR_018951 [Cinchona calisaya]|uniref:Uncharacterized protein n=1 Tax=Cinchona calisaya TaxID=153742 RepID=A0ABD2ZRK6_9GENT